MPLLGGAGGRYSHGPSLDLIQCPQDGLALSHLIFLCWHCTQEICLTGLSVAGGGVVVVWLTSGFPIVSLFSPGFSMDAEVGSLAILVVGFINHLTKST